MLGFLTPAGADTPTPTLRLQALTQETQDGCVGLPEVDVRVEAEVKQLTGRATERVPSVPVNPTLTPADTVQVFGGYVEPLDDGWWRGRLWLKDSGRAQVAVRDTYYRTLASLTVELPHDAAALILMPDWSRTASATPTFCHDQVRPIPYPEDACDAFLPPPSCGVPFDCTQSDQKPRCPTGGPKCGVAGWPPCPQSKETCRVRDWRFRSGIATLVAGGVAIGLGSVLQFAPTNSSTGTSAEACGAPMQSGSCNFDGTPAAITSYLVGGALLGTGAGLLGHWGVHAKKVPCKKGR